MLTATNNAGGAQGRHPVGPPGRQPVEAPRKAKPKSPLWAKLLIGFGVLILAISVGTFATFKFALGKIDDAIGNTSLLGGSAATPGASHALDGALNVLLVGTDERPGLEGNRADTIIVLHINAAHNKAYLLSIPRDTLTPIPAFAKSKFTGSKGDKINSAFEFGSRNNIGRTGGFELLANTVSQLTNLKFDGGAIINFDGFTSIVTALGGVNMCIDERTTSWDHDGNGNELRPGHKAMVYEVGCRKLVPWQALDYVRQRKSIPDGDYGRQRHQQQFIKAVAKDALSQGLTDPIKLNRLLGAAGQALTVDRGAGSLTDWLFVLKSFKVEEMTVLLTNAGQYASVTCPDGSSCQVLNNDSKAMFAAAISDGLPAFIAAHPKFVGGDGGPPTGATPPADTAQ
jgi:LCP family protein required for cell wall assembly